MPAPWLTCAAALNKCAIPGDCVRRRPSYKAGRFLGTRGFMARVVHASNFSRKAKGAFQHSVEHKITNGLIRNGHAVSNFSDRDVARAGTLLGHRAFGASAANRAFREFCRNVAPELIVLGHAEIIAPTTLNTV